MPKASSKRLTKKDVEKILAETLEKLPKGGISRDEVKKITKQQIEYLFGKI